MGAADDAVAALQAGQPVVLPFDTVYGLCATPYREDPVYRVYRLKGRPETMASAIVAAELDMLLECLPELRGRSAVIARALLPGPLTLIFPNPARRFRWLTGLNPNTIGVRVPRLEGDAYDVLQRAGAVMATSANRHGGPEPRTLEDVPEEIRSRAGAVIDGGELPGLPSTVIDFTGPEPRVLREGAVTAAEVLGRVPG
jgi:L-threonylcarbamoyladenylate synthase